MHTILPQEKNPLLRDIAHRVPLDEIKGARITHLVAEMKELLAKEKFGVALAAPQVGESLQLFIVSGRALMEHSEEEQENVPQEKDQVYINPELTKVSRKKSEKHEGCLSVRGKWGMVPRAEKATIRAYDENGKPFTRGASGFLAHIFQHEMDHLQGILYTDKATELYDDEPDEK